MAISTKAIDAILNTEAGVPLNEIGNKIKQLNEALEPLGMYVHFEENGVNKYNMDTILLPKWKKPDEYEQRVMSMDIKVDFFVRHNEESN